MGYKKAFLSFGVCAFLLVSVFIISSASAAKKPRISSITPLTGTQGQKVTVTIDGKNFSRKKSKNKVIVTRGGVKAKVKKASANQIKAKLIIDGDAEVGVRKLYVKVGEKKSNKKTFTIEAQSSADVVAELTSSDLGTVNASGWSSIASSEIATTGNPATGGHGALENELVTITLQAAHDSTYLYVRSIWDDSSQNNTHSVWTYSGESWLKAGNEDRMYMMFPITDVAGREGKTFAQVGCAMTCHLVDTDKQVVTNTIDTITNCGVCHPKSETDLGSSFVHVTVTDQGKKCDTCHEDREFDKDGADMASPAGGAFDIWHWKAGRSAPLNLAEDQGTVGPGKRGGDGSALTSNNGSLQPDYIWTPASGKSESDIILASKLFGGGFYYSYSYDASELWLSGELAVWNDTDSKYYAADTNSMTQTVVVENGGITKTVDIFTESVEVVLTDGLTVRNSIYNDDNIVEGSNGDLVSDSSYSNGKWTVVIKRKLDTGDPKDAKFESGNTYNFSVAVTDNSGINHKGSNLKTLLIQ